jgi:hypothetical protein
MTILLVLALHVYTKVKKHKLYLTHRRETMLQRNDGRSSWTNFQHTPESGTRHVIFIKQCAEPVPSLQEEV